MILSRRQKKYLVINQCLFPIFLNFIINGAIGWLVFHKMTVVPMQNGVSSIASDTLLTCLLLPAITCLAVTPGVRKLVETGKLTSVRELPLWLQPLNQSLLMKTLMFGVIGFSIGFAALSMMTHFQVLSAPARQFIFAKALFAGILGGVVGPLITLLAMAQPSPRKN